MAEEMEMEGLREVKVKMVVHLHPSRSANVPQGVHEILNSLLLRYNEHFEGSVLAHLDLKIQGHTATILEGLAPYFCVRLTTTLLLFSPKVGMIVEGKVNKVEKDYLGVVVLGLFNAAIGVSDIREDLYYEEMGGTRAWLSESDNRHCIKLGSIIRFSVKSVQENQEIVDLCGALQGAHTGCVKWLAGEGEAMERKNHGSPDSRHVENGEKKSKHKRAKREEGGPEGSVGTNDLATPKKKKKKKDKSESGGDSSHKKRRKSNVGSN